MKLILLLVISCLAFHNGKGAPTAVYKFVRCNPEGDQANCVIQQTPEMAWSPDLPGKLPASTAQYLEAEPVEDESSLWEEDKEEEMEEGESPMTGEEGESPMTGEEGEEGESPMTGEEGESPVLFLGEGGSGDYEGSAGESPFMADRASPAESETGSGDYWTENDIDLYKVGDMRGLRRLFPGRFLVGEAKPEEQELKEDHLLQL